jgi:TatA/E family protein of Tat protein translocase
MSTCHSTLAFIEGIGGPELLMIMFVVLLLFGGQKLPELAKGLGKSMREFKNAASGVEDEFKRAIEETPDKPTLPSARPTPTAERQEPPHT